MANTSAALEFSDHSVSFGARTTTEGVSLELVPGSILALVGESGSGKSVTALAALGLAGSATQTGSVRLTGPERLIGEGREARQGQDTELVGLTAKALRRVRGARVGVVFQEPMGAFNPMFRLGHQIAEAARAHGREPAAAGGAHTTLPEGTPTSPTDGAQSDDSIGERVRQQLLKSGLNNPDQVMRAYPHELSGGQLQRAMIALATINSPEVLFADEPTTALDVTVQTGILDLLRRQATEEGQAVLLITHDMGVVADIADRVAVMKSGRIVETGAVRDIFDRPKSEYTRELLDAVPRLNAVIAASTAEVNDRLGSPTAHPYGSATAWAESSPAAVPAVLAAELTAATVVHRSSGRQVTAMDSVDLAIPAGSITGLVGESGSGKSTIANVLTGGQGLTSGRAFVDGGRVSTRPTRKQRRLRSEIGVVFQDPRGSLNPRRSVGAQIAEPMRVHTDRGRRDIEAQVTSLLDDVRLPGDFAGRYPHELSGGQRQRVAIARALALGPKLLIADEPTSALDVSVQRGVLRLLADLHEIHEFACLFISHDLAVVEQLASTVVVLQRGAIVEQGPSSQVLMNPSQGYTRELIDSAPVPDPEVQAARRATRLAA